jgi:hypothetical protein
LATHPIHLDTNQYNETSIFFHYFQFQDYAGVVVMSTILGVILYMLVEAPFGQLVKVLLISPKAKSMAKPLANPLANGNSSPSNNDGISNNNVTHITSNGKSVNSNGKVISYPRKVAKTA